MLSVIIPALNEAERLNRTIDNIFATADGPVEVLVFDQGGNGRIDKRATVLCEPVCSSNGSEPVCSGSAPVNVGERRAMNRMVEEARGDHVMRIDAHCDFQPQGWDRLLRTATGDKEVTLAVLTALEPDTWTPIPGHWYGLTRLVASEGKDGRIGLEAKWQSPNRDHAHYKGVIPTMGATGCAMVMKKSWYEALGGMDEELPPMGAIGEEVAIKTWAKGGKVQTCCDVTVGHIFGTGGYNTEGVFKAQVMLWDRWGVFYNDVCTRPEFADFDLAPVRSALQHTPGIRRVVVVREDKDAAEHQSKVVQERIRRYQYIWWEDEHPDEKDLTEEEIVQKYASHASTLIYDRKINYDEDGNILPD